MKRIIAGLGILALCFSLCGAFGTAQHASAADATRPLHLPWSAYVASTNNLHIVRVNVRNQPDLKGSILYKQTIGTPVTVYASVKGDALLDGDTTWYRISPPKAPARYIYGRYVIGSDQVVPAKGKLILVSLAGQWLVAFQDGQHVLDTPVTTGRPELPTPTGIYHVLAKYTPYEFISPWPASSPYWYPPSRTSYALEFRKDGYFIHDAPWRTVFGPGTNLPHIDPGDSVGSHGCVNTPLAAQKTLFAWATVGTTIEIVP